MMKLRILPLAAALMLSAAPAAAQDLGNIFGPGPNPITMFKELFKAEPLTSAEEARLPAARQLADSLLPPGAYGKAIEESFAPMAGKIIAMVEADDTARAARLTGLAKYRLDGLDEAQLEAIIALLDPREGERNRQLADFVFAEISAAMVKVEPFYRDGLARAYARHFNAAQLAEINAFFATPTGNLYASTSVAMYLDPQVTAKFPDMVPVMVGHIAEAATRFVLAMDTIPQARGVDDLSSRERTQLLGLLGMSEEEYTTAKEFSYDPPAMGMPVAPPMIMRVEPPSQDYSEDDDSAVYETTFDGALEEVN